MKEARSLVLRPFSSVIEHRARCTLHRHDTSHTPTFDLYPLKALPSNQRDELPLGVGVPLDIALRHGETGVPSELLDVAQAPPNLGHFARGAGNEGAAARVRRAAVHV